MILRLTKLLRKLNHLIQMEVEGKKKKDRKKVGCFVDIHSLWNSEDVDARLMCKVKEGSVTLFFSLPKYIVIVLTARSNCMLHHT